MKMKLKKSENKQLLKEVHSECRYNGNQKDDSVFLTEATDKSTFIEPSSQRNFEELESIIANFTWHKPVSDVICMGKYLIFALDNLLPFQKPIGDYFKSAFVLCAFKPKLLSEPENIESVCDTSTSSPFGNPLLLQFENLVCPSPDTVSVLQRLNLMYDVYPLSVSTGKQLLFICSKFENPHKLPFISICHANRPGSLILYGVGGNNKSVHLKLLNQGNVHSLKNLPSIQDLKVSHLEGLPPALTSESSIETIVSTTYEFLGIDGCLSVQCSWSTVQSILEPLPTECVCFAKLKTVAVNNENGAFVRYEEIELLQALQHSLKSGVMTWNGSNSLDVIIQEINELVNEERKKIYSREYPELPDIEDNLESAIGKERIFLSLPDKLWLIMKNCSSFGDLIAVIEHTYKAFAELNIASPIAHGHDLSTISKDIYSLFNKEVCCPDLNQEKATEMLLEIGVEKMRRDYYEYFIGHGFVSQDLFNNFTSSKLLSQEAITCLEKLHSVLELALVCIKQLKLPRSIINEFARNALKLYTTIPEIDLQHVFTFHIPTFDIRSVLNMMRPVVWELSLKSEDENFLKQTCHRFVTTATHDHIYAPQNYNPKQMLEKASYVYSIATLSEEKILL